MKIRYSNNLILISMLPALLFFLGLLSLESSEFSLPVINTYDVLSTIVVLFITSYLFLKDSISVFISIGSTVNTMLGTLFFIDFFNIEYSVMVVLGLIISLGFSVFGNTILLCLIHQNKRASEATANRAVKKAVKKAVKISFATIILFVFTLLLIFAFEFFKSLSQVMENFCLVLIIGSIIAIINLLMLLPVFSIFSLGHINQERMQDDLIPTFLEKLLDGFNERMEKNAALLTWIISPIVNKRIFSVSLAVLAFVLFFLLIPGLSEILLIENSSRKWFLIIVLIYFFSIVLRYQSYILACMFILSLSLSYFLLFYICNGLLWNSNILTEATISISMAISIIGTYLQTDAAILYHKKGASIKDAILNSTAKIFHLLFTSALVMVFFVLYSIYILKLDHYSYKELFLAGGIIISSCLLTLFPAPAYLSVFLTLHKYVIKPRKRKIKSIYL